jgi:hypothetical protein
MLHRDKKGVIRGEESARMGKPYGEGSFPLIAGCFATAQHDISLCLPNIS